MEEGLPFVLLWERGGVGVLQLSFPYQGPYRLKIGLENSWVLLIPTGSLRL
jgi:hypothetical protein